MFFCKDGNKTNKQFGVGLESQMSQMSQIHSMTFSSGEETPWGEPNSSFLIVKIRDRARPFNEGMWDKN